jgi:hypothetical protein
MLRYCYTATGIRPASHKPHKISTRIPVDMGQLSSIIFPVVRWFNSYFMFPVVRWFNSYFNRQQRLALLEA